METHPGPEQGAATSWAGHYNYALQSVHRIEALRKSLSREDLATYQKAIREGYNEIRTELLRDLASGPLPKRQIAWVKASVLGSVGIPGDIELGQSGRLSLRINMDNYGSFVDKLAPYTVWIFPTSTQYTFDNGPVERQDNP
ncbi:MAG: hypothetical protein HY348_13805 [Nitrospira defluvii]|nr:hypothetical protein [Nitrospira defluvii]